MWKYVALFKFWNLLSSKLFWLSMNWRKTTVDQELLRALDLVHRPLDCFGFRGNWFVSVPGIACSLHCYRSSNPRGLSIRFNGWLVIAVSTAGRAIALLAQFRVLAANAHGIGNMGHPPPCQPSTQPRASTSHQNQHLIMHHRIAEQHHALLNKAKLTGLPL